MVEDQVREFVNETFLIFEDDLDIDDSDSFFDTGIIDSTGVQELAAFIEKTFNIQINDDEFIPDNLDSIEKLCRFIRRKRDSVR